MVLPGFIGGLIIQKDPVCPPQQGSCRRWALYSDRESNPDQRFRKPPFYPLNYQSKPLIEMPLIEWLSYKRASSL